MLLSPLTMRRATLVLALLAGCSVGPEAASYGDPNDVGSGSGAGGVPSECRRDADCVPAGPKCCDCPTHAVPVSDPSQRACSEVDCPTPSCGSPMQAACTAGRCTLECAPVACPGASCESGFSIDGNGCLTCSCAPPPAAAGCAVDTDCARVREDCCGCAQGGADTAVLASEVASHDAALMCPASPSCPGIDTCAPDLAPRCVQGACALVSGALPARACGRSDLPACGAGETCTVNADPQATMYGVGICQP